MAAGKSLIHDTVNARDADEAMFDTSDEKLAEAAMSATGAGQLKQFIERLERLAEEKAAISNDMKEVMSEVKSAGFDTKIVRKVIRFRAQDKAKRQEEDAIFDLYLVAIGEV